MAQAQAQAQVQAQDQPLDPAIEDFLGFLNKNELSCENYELSGESNELSWVSNGPKFVCINAVRTHLDGERNDCTPLEELLRGLYRGADEKPKAETILFPETESYVAILCILTTLGKGHLIHHFVTKSLHDGHLPLRGPHHEPFPLNIGYSDLYKKFCCRQWMFCVPHFTKAKENIFDNDRILPITNKTLVGGGGGSAEVYEIRIHACYNRFHDDGRGSPRKKCPSTSDEMSNTFVLKTYTTPSAPKDYETEKKAYQKLAERDVDKRYIVNFYGNFTHVGTHNIIMERADEGSLEDYFQKHTPPSESEHIRQFWENLFHILIALQSIHHVEQTSNGLPRVLKGWHQDVKPANILVFSDKKSSPYEFTFKLADFGTSHFKEMAEVGLQGTATDSYGTSTYGAPECYRSDGWERSPLQVKQKVDVWSFGCILSEAAVWVNNGYYAGVQKYRSELLKEAASKNPRLGTCFHNGTEVCRTVRRWHDTVQRTHRRSDETTPGVLEHIENDMLLRVPDRRLDPITLWSRAEDLLLENRSAGMASMSPNSSEPHSNTDETPSYPIPPPIPPIPRAPPAHRAPSTPAPLALPNGVRDMTPSDPEIDSRKYPYTHKYLQEQDQTSEKCKEILSRLSKGEKSLREHDIEIARGHFNRAREAVSTFQKSENHSQMLANVRSELHLHSWTGMEKCELAIIDQADPPLLIEEEEAHRKKAERYAKGALEGQKRIGSGAASVRLSNC